MDEYTKDWELILKAAAEFQGVVPGSTLVGGTASAVYAQHRQSFDADHIIDDLPQRFESLIEMLEERGDWATAKILPPKLALGNFQGVETGLRQLRRTLPLETQSLSIGNCTLKIPTPEEMLRIKGWLIISRNKVRDFLDFVALSDHLGNTRTRSALALFDQCYLDIYHAKADREVSPMAQLSRQLQEPKPGDMDSGLKVAHYKGIKEPWSSWEYIEKRCLSLAALSLSIQCTPSLDDPDDDFEPNLG